MKIKHLTLLAGCTLILAGCAHAPKVQIPASIKLLDDFDDISSWSSFAAPNATVEIKKDTCDAANGNAALSFKYSMGDWGGIGETFKTKQNWTINDSLFFAFKGDGNGKKVRVEITDNGGERFEKTITVDFKGWMAFTFPLKDMTRRKDWQPKDAPDDGLTLTEVEGISFSPIEKGQGDWAIDVVGIVPDAATK